MKFKTTAKEVKKNFENIICIPYCDAYYLLALHIPQAYTCGVYGWNANVYDLGNVVIVTGYRPFGNITPDAGRLREYERRAKNLFIDYCSKEREIKMQALLDEFIDEMLKGE